jgi:hypothetical protein
MTPPPPPAEYAFAAAVEEFVAAQGWVPYPHLRGVVGHRHAAYLRMLSLPDYEIRRIARELLEREGWAAWPTLAWGERHPDPEVRRACRALTAPRFACPTCRGRGRVVAHVMEPETCWSCDGSGDRRGKRDD